MTASRSWRGRVFIAMSLDGFIARPDGNLDWLQNDTLRNHIESSSQNQAEVWETFFPSVDTIVMGRGTYETVASFDKWPFAEKKVIVLSSTVTALDTRVQLAKTLEEVYQLLHQYEAQQVYVDGGKTIQSFLAAGYVDELTVSIAPILLGSGKKLFGDLPADILLTVTGQHTTAEDGLTRITYRIQK